MIPDVYQYITNKGFEGYKFKTARSHEFHPITGNIPMSQALSEVVGEGLPEIGFVHWRSNLERGINTQVGWLEMWYGDYQGWKSICRKNEDKLNQIRGQIRRETLADESTVESRRAYSLQLSLGTRGILKLEHAQYRCERVLRRLEKKFEKWGADHNGLMGVISEIRQMRQGLRTQVGENI